MSLLVWANLGIIMDDMGWRGVGGKIEITRILKVTNQALIVTMRGQPRPPEAPHH